MSGATSPSHQELAHTSPGPPSAVLHRHIALELPTVTRAEGIRLFLQDGRSIFDASGGAAVSCLGHGDARIIEAVVAQMKSVAYCSTFYYTTSALEQLCEFLVASTGRRLSRACIVGSGSEAMEAAIKLARQYYLEKMPAEPRRTRFIARRQSYHGITLGALGVGGHAYRRNKFEPLLNEHTSLVSPCYPYRDKVAHESDEAYVQRLAKELDAEFTRLGPETVCAFIVEPVVGAALGCVPAVQGYLQAVRNVCDKHGALLIFDEVMCGMGRTGTLHAWEQDGVTPDIQTIGKGLGAGFVPVAGILANDKIIGALARGSGAFVHGHTFQGHPVACAAALRVQQVIESDCLLTNVRQMGEILGRRLMDGLIGHPHVGDIRGKGLFWGIEFVQDKALKKPFPASAGVAIGLSTMGLSSGFGISVYPGGGTADGVDGDHIMICPPYNVSEADIVFITDTVVGLVNRYFE